MGRILKWAGIGCGGLLGLLVVVMIIGVAVSVGDSDEPEISVADSASSVGDSDEPEISDADSASIGGLSTVPKVPDGKERTNPLPRGYSITHNDLKVTVMEVSYSFSEGGLFASLEKGHVWAIVKLRLEAVGNPNKSYRYNTLEFRLVGDKGVIYDDWIAVPENDMGSGEFFGGATLDTDVVRQIHEDDTNLVLIYSPAFKGSRYLALESDP